MKYILLFLLLPLFTFGQSNYDIRADSVRIYKSGGFSELVLRNKTKDSVNGILTNLGNGVTAFVRVKKINDSSFTVGTDTISLKGGITTGGTDSTLANLWGIKILQSGIVRYLMADSFAVESRARGNKIADSIGVRLDTSKNNVWAAMMARIINGGGASKITVGAIGSRPAASNCQCFWVSASDSSISYDNGGWIPLGKAGTGGSLPSISNYSYRGKLSGSDTTLQYSIYNVLDFGIKNDSSADMTAKLQALVNLAPAGAQIYFPPGRYRLDHQIVFTKPVRIQGSNEAIKSHIIPPHSASWEAGSTAIYFTSASDTAFLWKSNGITVRDICLAQANGVTPTTSVGIMGDSANDSRLYNDGIMGFNRNVHIINGFQYSMENCLFFGPKDYNLIIEDTAQSDAGDMKISNNWFWAGVYNMNSHVLHKSGGGLWLTADKFNGSTMGGSYKYGYENAFNLSDVDVFITSPSIENFDSSGVFMHPATTFTYTTITGGEISFPHGAGQHRPYIWLKASVPADFGYVSINGVVMGGTTNDTAIFMDGNRVSNVTITPGTFNGFKTNIVSSGGGTFNTAARSPFYYVLTGQNTTFDFNQSNIATHTIVGVDTIAFANGLEREPFTITLTQNGAGTGTVYFPNAVNVATGGAVITTNIANGNIVVSGYSNSGGANVVISRVTRSFTNTSIPYWDNTNGLAEDVSNLAYNKGNSSLIIGGRTTGINGQIDIATNLSNFIPSISLGRHTSDVRGATAIFKKSRGTMSSPTIVSSGDYLSNNWMEGYDGSAYYAPSSFGAYVDSTASSASIPSSFFIHSGTGNDIDPKGSQLIDLNIDHRGRIGVGRNQITDTALLTVGYSGSFGSFNNGAWGNLISVRQTKLQNWGAGATTANYSLIGIRLPEFNANNSQTYTNGYTVYIEGAPISGANVTQTNKWALGVGAGNSLFGGLVKYSGNFHSQYDARTLVDSAWVDSILSVRGGVSNPFADNTALVKNNADNTKLWKVSAASITAGTTRTWTAPDYDGTFAALDHTQTFSQKQTYSVANRFNGLSNPSNLAYKIAVIDSTTGDMYWVSPSSPINVYDLGSGGSQQRANTNGDSLYVRTSYTNGHADDTLSDGGINHVTGNVFNQTADGSVTNTNTTTSILGTGQGSKTIATGKLYVGQTIVVKGFGYISTDATTPTLTITFANSSSNSGNAVNSLLSSSMNNVPIEWEYYATIRTTGSSGSIQLNGWVSIGGTKAYLASSAASTFNTTTNQTFDVTALFNNASTNNTITTKQCTVSIN